MDDCSVTVVPCSDAAMDCELDVVVTVSFFDAQEASSPAAARKVMEEISVRFISGR